jgi:tetratricopeptide (TPR) repeat protein
MGRPLALMMLMLLAASLASPPAHAQQAAVPIDREPDVEVKPYQHPSAQKSVEIGDFYFRRKRYRAALDRYQEAATTNPHYPRAYLGLGKVYEKIGFKQKALASYQRYLDELPSTKDALEAKDAQRAVARLERQLHTRPTGQSKAPAPQTP